MSNAKDIGFRVGAAYNQATQIAAVFVGNGDLSDDAVAPFIEDLAADLCERANKLQDELTAAIPSTPAVPAPATPQQAQQMVENAFPGTTEQAYDLQIKGTAHGPIPAWLIEEARSLGVTEVWDNRDDLGPKGNRPHFKSVDDVTFTKQFRGGGSKTVTEQYPFWPPKAA